MERRRFRVSARAWLVATALFALWIGLGLAGARAVDDVGTALAAMTACAMCARAALRHRGRRRLSWSLLAAACACWTLAETIWAVYDLGSAGSVPVPSWADAGYLGALPLVVAALWCHPALSSTTKGKLGVLLDGLVLATALLFTSWTLLLGPLWRSTSVSATGALVTLAYPFCDVVIVFFVLLAIRRVRGEDRVPMWCLLGALLALALSDTAYAYLTETGRYASAEAIDTGWVAAYLGIALAAYCSRSVGAIPRPTPKPALAILTPFAPALLALAVAGAAITFGHDLDGASTLMLCALVVLVPARQLLLVAEVGRRGRRADGSPLRQLVRVALGRTGSPS